VASEREWKEKSKEGKVHRKKRQGPTQKKEKEKAIEEVPWGKDEKKVRTSEKETEKNNQEAVYQHVPMV